MLIMEKVNRPSTVAHSYNQATQDAEIRRMAVRGHPRGERVSETLSQPQARSGGTYLRSQLNSRQR
jgi:cephalosporin-C deacetylase-like acetyl esterase